MFVLTTSNLASFTGLQNVGPLDWIRPQKGMQVWDGGVGVESEQQYFTSDRRCNRLIVVCR